jgi:hypothetical protein
MIVFSDLLNFTTTAIYQRLCQYSFVSVYSHHDNYSVRKVINYGDRLAESGGLRVEVKGER